MVIIAGAVFAQQSFYDFKVKDIDGKDFDLASLKGKKVLIVNTASKCGNTPQYEQLQDLYEKYGEEKFTIIGFPANNFGQQEPGTNKEIEEYCTKNYGVTFQMMEKISVKGDDMHPLYQWLTQKSKNAG
jgi:glutathione peroxidase